MATNEEIATILREAADSVQFEGWIRGAYTAGKSHCAVGALEHVARARSRNSSPRVIETCSALLSYLKSHVDERITGVEFWNDQLAKDEHEVAETMRLCAKGLENAD